MFLSKRVIVVILAILILVEWCEAAKTSKLKLKEAKKKKAGGKKVSKKSKKGKKKETTPKSPAVIARSAPYVEAPDTKYWESAGYKRVWTEKDSPVNNVHFNAAYDLLLESLTLDNLPLDLKLPLTALTEADMFLNSTKFLEWFIAMDRMEELAVPTLVLPQEFTGIDLESITWAAHLDSSGGKDVPPILKNYCTVPECLDRGVKFNSCNDHDFWEPHPVYLPSEVYTEQSHTPADTLLDDLLSKVERHSRTFTFEDTVDILCGDGYVESTVSSVDAVLEKLLGEDMDVFLQAPGQNSNYLAGRRLFDLHEINSAQLLRRVVQSLCKGKGGEGGAESAKGGEQKVNAKKKSGKKPKKAVVVKNLS